MATMKQGQSKRAEALERQAKDQGIQWLGRDGGTWTLVGRKGPMHRRTIGQMKELLDSHEHDAAYVGDHYVLSPIDPDGKPHERPPAGPEVETLENFRRVNQLIAKAAEPHLPPRTPDDDEDDDEANSGSGIEHGVEPFTTGDEELYIAKAGDTVLIDARTDNEIQGTVSKVDGDIVTVRATRVLLRGRPRPDFEGFIYYPFQNGIEQPWGLTNSLEKTSK